MVFFFLFIYLFFFVPFFSVKRPFQDYFSSYETGQSVNGAKKRTPRKTTWHTRKQNLACLTCAPCEARTHTRHSGEMVKWLSAVMKYQRSKPLGHRNRRFVILVDDLLIMSGNSYHFPGINQYNAELMCLAQLHNTVLHVGMGPRTS